MTKRQIPLSIRRPMDEDSAQYSLPLSVALALLHRNILPAHLQPSSYDNSAVWGLVDKVSFEESDDYNSSFPDERFAHVTLHLNDSRTLKSDTSVARGNYDAPLSNDEIVEKFNLYASSLLSESDRLQIANILTDPLQSPTPSSLFSLLINDYPS